MNTELRAAREKAGLTQKQVAENIGITEQAYQIYEYNKREPKARMAVRVAESVGSTVEKIWGSCSIPSLSLSLSNRVSKTQKRHKRQDVRTTQTRRRESGELAATKGEKVSNHIALSQELIESVSEAELAKIKDKFLYSVGVNEESGHLEIHAMNNGHIVLHSVDEARFFTSLIMDHFRKV